MGLSGRRLNATAIGAGALAYTALAFSFPILMGWFERSVVSVPATLGSALTIIVVLLCPGFLAGLIARERSLLHGALAGLAGYALSICVVLGFGGLGEIPSPGELAAMVLLAGAVAVTCAGGALAGGFLVRPRGG